jgi:formylglycine-generating enzyme required for sulfatase activity
MRIEFCAVAGGTFRMGSDPHEIQGQMEMFDYALRSWSRREAEPWFRKHTPARTVSVHDFEMSRSLITRGQYAHFERAVFGVVSHLTVGDPMLPVEGVSYHGARQFTEWLSLEMAVRVALPTEPQWEFAASSRGRYRFPWGDDFDPTKANTIERGIGRATEASVFAAGQSEQGILDLAGNLEEWTDSVYLPYPGAHFVHDRISEENDNAYPILRGGCYRHHGDLCLAVRRHGYRKGYTPVGFRVVKNIAELPQTQNANGASDE